MTGRVCVRVCVWEHIRVPILNYTFVKIPARGGVGEAGDITFPKPSGYEYQHLTFVEDVQSEGQHI